MLADPFAPELTRARRDQVRAAFRTEHPDAVLLVSDPTNIRYLSGFDGSSGALAIAGDHAALYTDSRYIEQAALQAPGIALVAARNPLAQAMTANPGPVLLEGAAVPAGSWQRILAAHPAARLVEDLVEGVRAIKDTAEIAAIECACKLSANALNQVLAERVAGRTEREVARQLEWLLGDDPGEGPGFPSIIATGANSSRPHHNPTDRRIEPGDLLKIDFGARVLGYHADITRTFLVAARPAPWQQELHDLVARAQVRGLAAATAGTPIVDVDAAARQVITEAGHGGHFGHGLGHGVGLAIHERPLIGPNSAGTLAEGMAITIEPGVYLPGRGGVRIEDTVVVAGDTARPLATLTRDLLVVR